MKIATAKGVFKGFYEWGPGWTVPEAAAKWREFWDNLSGVCHWRHFNDGRSDYLVSVGGSVFLHPMDFSLLHRQFGATKVCQDGADWKVRYDDIEELREVCERCAKHCGGSFELVDLRYREI